MAKNNLRTSFTLVLKDGSEEIYKDNLVFRKASKDDNNKIVAQAEELDEKVAIDGIRYENEKKQYDEDFKSYMDALREGETLTKPKSPKMPYNLLDAIGESLKYRLSFEIVSGDLEGLYALMDEWGAQYIYDLIIEAKNTAQGKQG